MKEGGCLSSQKQIRLVIDFEKLRVEIEKCINSLGEKFIRYPYNFFTESDAHSFLYYYIFRSGYKQLKLPYPTKDPFIKTVLVHREYPTNFRYRKYSMELDEKGGRGHYDLVVLNPEFVANHSIAEIMAKDFKKTCKDESYHLLAAIELKLIANPLSGRFQDEIEKDFCKLSWAIDKKHAWSVYMVIFNRCRHEEAFVNKLDRIARENPNVRGLYIESVLKPERNCYINYINNWEKKLPFKHDNSGMN